ncbi:hypothetical protein [Klenkia taihuensis]|uniref:Uncharacterized protein n=1 Tax=Klenkia taihuensis TaxID=1225127 RepID=A0A1I1JZD9_9ACTN|nr:hypothetical protein [Klenkia taihuensis]GHE10762.1 hypothetical protein GCM10011381_21300 [Klenkia taihuensis]SFC50750.1 hypothetical protein SAMN05661030_1151 [Klenkia taihuensis]
MSQSDDRTRAFPAAGSGPAHPEPARSEPARPDLADQQTTEVHPVAPLRQETAPAPVAPRPAPQPEPPVQTWRPPADQATAPAWSTKPVAVRRADSFGALCLLLAGVAAALSLLLPWVPDGATGLELARRVVEQARTGWTGLFDTGLWQPGAVLAGGAVLFLLGLLLLVPARAHRFLGLLALLVAGLVVAAVLVPLAGRAWQPGRFDVGFWFAMGVAGLGVLGALKALLTGRRLR